MTNKTTYVQKVESELASWKNDVFKFKIIAEEAGWEEPDRQIKYYQIIEDITSKEKEVAEKLSALKDDDDSNWHVSAHEIDALRKDITKAVTSARSIVT